MTRLAKTGWACAVLIVGLLFGAAESMAQSPAQRHIVLNGQYLDALNVAALDYLNCGRPVPNGRYWVNWVQRTWGYEGGPAQGRLQDCTRGARQSAPARGGSSRYVEDRIFERSGVSIIQNPVYQ
jgi:hypothetical protein